MYNTVLISHNKQLGLSSLSLARGTESAIGFSEPHNTTFWNVDLFQVINYIHFKRGP